MKTNYCAQIYPGHGGGDWGLLNFSNHPAGMTYLLEIFKEEMLRFEERGIPRDVESLDREIIRVFEYRMGKDACVGIAKFEHPAILRWITDHDGRIFHLIRNPIALIGTRFGRKNDTAREEFRRLYGQDARTPNDLFEGTVLKYKIRFHQTYLDRLESEGWPTLRLEDLNASVGGGGMFFKRAMEWVTQTEWPLDYIAHIRMHYTPAHNAESRAIFDENWNLLKIVAWPNIRWRARLRIWDAEDTSKFGSAAYWKSWTDDQRKIYLKHYGALDRRMGYNQSHPGSIDRAWEQEGAFGEVDGA